MKQCAWKVWIIFIEWSIDQGYFYCTNNKNIWIKNNQMKSKLVSKGYFIGSVCIYNCCLDAIKCFAFYSQTFPNIHVVKKGVNWSNPDSIVAVSASIIDIMSTWTNHNKELKLSKIALQWSLTKSGGPWATSLTREPFLAIDSHDDTSRLIKTHYYLPLNPGMLCVKFS